MERNSNLLQALNAQRDETPGRASFTTIRSLSDEATRPTAGKRPTSALEGARNMVVQQVCPGRETMHIGVLEDSVTFAALTDAVARKGKAKKGAAKPSRFEAGVCDHLYAIGLDEALTDIGLDLGPAQVFARITADPKVLAEPKVRAVFKRRPSD